MRREGGVIDINRVEERIKCGCKIDNCYDPFDSFEISLFDELDACYACGQGANTNYAYGDELAIVPDVMNEIVAIAPTHLILSSTLLISMTPPSILEERPLYI